MTFTHLNKTVPEQAVQISTNGEGPRLYTTPKGLIYPSITTVLNILSEEHIEKWKKRIGEETAEYESAWAANRGSLLHSYIEDFLKNKPIRSKMNMAYALFLEMKPWLKKVDNIHLQETALFSDMFKMAGRVDTIAEYEGILSVVDFKGSNKTKKTSWIENYFMQTSFYAYAYFERTGIKIPQCVILISCEKGAPQEFIINPKDWWTPLQKVRKDYKERYGI